MPSDVFSLLFTRKDGKVVVHVAGEVDMATAPALREALEDLIVDQGNLYVTVDLAHTTFMDSTGLHALVLSLNSVRARGGFLTLADPPATILRLFEMTGLTKVFDIVSSDATGPAGAPDSLQTDEDVDLAS